MANEFVARNGLIAKNNSVVSGSLTITGGITGSLLGTASYSSQALSASFTSTASYVNPLSQSVEITGSLNLTGSFRALVTGSDLVNIGNASTANQRLVRIGQDTAFIDIGSRVTAASTSAIYMHGATPTANNFNFAASNTALLINVTSGGSILIQNGTSTQVSLTNTTLTFTAPTGINSGAYQSFIFSKGNHTNQTLSTPIVGFQYNLGTRQWATGNITTQQEYLLTAPTYSFVGASTITSSYAMFVNAAAAGTNATITNNYAAGFSGNVNIISGSLGIQRNAAPLDAIHVGDNDGNTQKHIQLSYNCVIGAMTGQSSLGPSGGNGLGYYMPTNSAGNSFLVNRLSTGTLFLDSFRINIRSSNVTTGAVVGFTYTGATNTGQTASTPINGVLWTLGSRQWATGNITTQQEYLLTAPTYSFVGASTITNSYTFYVEAAAAGTNATITNNFAAGFNGGIRVLTGGANITGPLIVAGNTSLSGFLNMNNNPIRFLGGTASAPGLSWEGYTTTGLGLYTSTTDTLSIATSGSERVRINNNGITITGSLNVSNSVTASIISASAFTGSLFGTASYASQALSASYSDTASYVLQAVSASYAVTASFAFTASYIDGGFY